MNERRHIAVVGVGAVGGWLAARLALAGHQVTALARTASLPAFRNGLTLSCDGREEKATLAVSDRPEELPPQQLLIIATKATALAEAAAWAAPLARRSEIILPLQNGVPFWFADGAPLVSVDPGGELRALLPRERLLAGVVHAAVRRRGPAEVEVVHADRLLLGEIDGGASERASAMVALFADSGVPAVEEAAIRRAIWYKLWGNGTLNPLSALTRATADRLLADPVLRSFLAEGMREMAAVGAAAGCPITEDPEERMAVTARLGAFKTSMLQDVEAGRPLEIDALLGAPRELGRRNGVPTPTLDLLDAMTRQLARSLQSER